VVDEMTLNKQHTESKLSAGELGICFGKVQAHDKLYFLF
jgi:hypothetical protein